MATPEELTTGRSANPALRDRAGRNLDAWGDPVARGFLTGQGLYLTADSMTALTLATVLLVGSDNTIEPRALVTALTLAMLPYAVIGPLSGALADRWNRRRALGGLGTIRALLTAAVALAVAVGSETMALVAAAPLMCAGRLFYMLRAASLPRVAPPGLLVRVDACSLYVSITASAIGASIAATELGGATMVLSAAAGLQLLAGLKFLTLPISLGGGDGKAHTGSWEAAVRAMTQRPTRTVVGLTVTHRLLLGALFGTLLVVASHDLGLADRAHLVGLVVTSLGSFAGTLTAPHLRFRLGLERLAAAAFVAPAVVLLASLSLRHDSAGGAVALGMAAVVTYFAFQNTRVATDAVVQTSTHDASRAKLFSLYDAAYNVAYYGGAAAAIAAGFHLRPTSSIGIIGAAYGLVALALVSRPTDLDAPSTGVA